MEFIERNFINTTGVISVESNTTTAKNMFNFDKRFQYLSDGFNNDLTSTVITINFDETTTVNRISMIEHNLKSFRLFYDGVTANAFELTSTAATSTANFNANSESAHYFFTTQVDVTSVSLQMDSTIVADSEKAIGIFVISALKLNFDRIPNAGGYTPLRIPKQVLHTMSDGGVRKHKSHDKWKVNLKFSDITESFRNSLFDIYEDTDSRIFVPFGTSASWDGILFDAVWVNQFEFYKFAENSTTQGHKGNIVLKERS